jgi:TRAP-type C4-dicarboxylate transport system permease small subunit
LQFLSLGVFMLKKIYTVFDRIRIYGIIIALGWMVVLCFTQVVLRYFAWSVLRPFSWGDEILRMSSIWVTFLAAGIGVREGAHLHLDYFIAAIFKGKNLIIVKKIILGVSIGVICILMYHGILQTYSNRVSSLQHIRISLAWFMVAIPVGCFYIIVDFLLILIYGRHPFARSTAPVKNPSVANAV